MNPAPLSAPRRSALFPGTALALVALLSAGRGVFAQDTPPGTPEPAAPPPEVVPAPPPVSSPAPDIHPDAVSSFQVRAYKTSEKKLWKGLLQVLQEAGYPPEEVDAKGKRVKTSFVDFSSKDYSEEVADAAPRLGGDYHILQMSKVKLGKVSLEGVITGGEHGASVLSLRARILVDGLDQRKRVRLLTDRRSSGVIESDFLRRLEDTLKLERQLN
ncbi:MAG TPA: hypothetical protein VFQ07_03695 [Candidatus Polarisedimenticolia bacterium]|nr:hypothetical protein [Candidatus Polarisedimenticolia bacterium]